MFRQRDFPRRANPLACSRVEIGIAIIPLGSCSIDPRLTKAPTPRPALPDELLRLDAQRAAIGEGADCPLSFWYVQLQTLEMVDGEHIGWVCCGSDAVVCRSL
jgi:hypothetical protein